MAKKSSFKVWHGVLTAVFVFGLGLGITLSVNEVFALTVSDPNSPFRISMPGLSDLSSGINLGQSAPSTTPGSPSQPVPKFSGINAPWIVNENGPVQIPDDVVLYGLTDVRGALINLKSAPVTIFDDLSIKGNGSTKPGNLTIAGDNITAATPATGSAQILNIKSSNASTPLFLRVNGKLNVSDDVSLSKRLYVTNDASLSRNLTVGPASLNPYIDSLVNSIKTSPDPTGIATAHHFLSDKQITVGNESTITLYPSSTMTGAIPNTSSMYTASVLTAPLESNNYIAAVPKSNPKAPPPPPPAATPPAPVTYTLHKGTTITPETLTTFTKVKNPKTGQFTDLSKIIIGSDGTLTATGDARDTPTATFYTTPGLLTAGTLATTRNVVANGYIVGDTVIANNVSANSLTVTGDINSPGNITANKIGAYYLLTQDGPLWGTNGSGYVTVTCGNGDINISCNGSFIDSANPANTNILDRNYTDGKTCSVHGKKTAAATRSRLSAAAICFNPDGSTPTGYTGTLTNL